MNSSSKHNLAMPESGFTLVEIIVALAIGMLASLVIMQVFSVFEAQKRTTTGTADAQTNGSIALYSINRDMQMAGYPLIPESDSPLECAALTNEGIPGLDHSTFSPVTIIDGALSDSITIRYGTSSSGGVSSKITAVGAPAPNDITLGSNLGCQVNDRALIINGAGCAMSTVTALTGNTTVTLSNITGAVPGAGLACLGNWNTITYAVNNGNLELGGAPIMTGIVNLQAQYGVSLTATSNAIALWVDATGVWAAPTLADRNRIKAVRIAVVARNAKMEADVVTPAPVVAWAGAGAPVVDLTGDANWDHYRYRVFETVIPLRNVIWARGAFQ